MEELELLQQVFSRRMQWVRESGRGAEEGFRRSPLKERLADPGLAGAVALARQAMAACPDVRNDQVKSVRDQLRDGSLPLDGKDLADRLLQESVLCELM